MEAISEALMYIDMDHIVKRRIYCILCSTNLYQYTPVFDTLVYIETPTQEWCSSATNGETCFIIHGVAQFYLMGIKDNPYSWGIANTLCKSMIFLFMLLMKEATG